VQMGIFDSHCPVGLDFVLRSRICLLSDFATPLIDFASIDCARWAYSDPVSRIQKTRHIKNISWNSGQTIAENQKPKKINKGNGP